jgi:putative transposase
MIGFKQIEFFDHMGWLSLRKIRYLLHDRDTKYCASFRETLAAGGVKSLRLAARSPNLNWYAERWVRTVKKSACGS